jgi:DNA-binding PadR family transcriptional regulator
MRTMENQVIRDQLLQLLREAGPNGASRKVINLALKKSGFRAEEQQVTEALHYLKVKGLVWVADTTNNALGIHMDVYIITPDGIDTLEGTREEPGIGVGDV